MNVTIETGLGNITLSGEPSALYLITSWLYSASYVAYDSDTHDHFIMEHADPEIRECANTLFDAIYDYG